MLPATFDAWSAHIALGYEHHLQDIHRLKDCPVVVCKASDCGQPCHLCQALSLMREAWKVASEPRIEG